MHATDALRRPTIACYASPGMAIVLASLGAALALSVALFLFARRSSRGARRLALTRITHLLPDENDSRVHVFGASRTMPEYGDSVDIWQHVFVDVRRGLFVAGESQIGDDFAVDSPFVKRSLEKVSAQVREKVRPKHGKTSLRVALVRDTETDTARPSKNEPPRDGLFVRVFRHDSDRASTPHVAQLHIGGTCVGEHTFDAIEGTRIAACWLEGGAIALFGYVGSAWGNPIAHLVAIDAQSRTVLFDRACEA